MKRAALGLWCLMGAALLTGCGSAPPRPSPQKEAAIEWNRRAQSAYRGGDLAASLAAYQQALAVNRAIEDVEGVATELLNVAAVARDLGEHDRAHAVLDELLVSPALPFSGEQRAEAAYRKAHFLLDAGRARDAGEWLDRVPALCAGPCAPAGKAGNLRARIAFERGDYAQAQTQARAALALNGKHEDRAESANSLRLLGDAALALSDAAGAREAYQQAFELDKALGAGRKIALDLIGIGRSLLAEGRITEAADYLRRARSVAEGVADPGILATVDRLLAQTGKFRH